MPTIHTHAPTAEPLRLLRAVGHDYGRGAFVNQFFEHHLHGEFRPGIERGRWLVEEEDAWQGFRRSQKAETLLFACSEPAPRRTHTPTRQPQPLCTNACPPRIPEVVANVVRPPCR